MTAALLHFIWQGTAVAFLLWFVLIAMRRRPAAERYAACAAALALMAALPVLTATCGAGFSLQRALARPSVATALPASIQALAATSPNWLSQIRPWIVPLWAAGVFLFAVRLALGYRHVAQLRRAGQPADASIADRVSALAQRMSIPRSVRILVSSLADCPSVVGWLRPAILIPASALAGLDAAQLEAILAHELAHIRRHDFLVNALQTVVETLLFYHPAVWWVSARMRHERELCCDDLAVLHCGDAISYARALSRLERIRVMPEPVVAANGASLLYRIQRLTGAVRECAPSRLPVVLAVVAVAACLPVAVHRAQGQEPAAQPIAFTYSEPDQTAAVSGSIVARYPEAAIAKGITGTIVAEATLDAAGAVVDARVLTGPIELRKAALRAVLEWRAPDATAGEVRQVNVEFTQDAPLLAKAARDKRVALEFQVNPLDQSMDQLNKTLQTLGSQTPQELSDQMAALERALEQMRSTEEPQKTRQALESLGALEKQLEDARQIYTDQHPSIRAIEQEARRRLEAVEKLAELERTSGAVTDWAAGSKVVRIEGENLPPGITAPVALGDVLTRQSIEAFNEAVKARQLRLAVHQNGRWRSGNPHRAAPALIYRTVTTPLARSLIAASGGAFHAESNRPSATTCASDPLNST